MATKIHSQTLLPSHLPMESPSSPSQTDLKLLAAHHAADLVRSGMVLGLGTGSTSSLFLDRLSLLLRRGSLHNIIGIPTSKKTELYARALNIPLSDLDSHPNIDLSIDGADEVDPNLNLVKGRGGSLLREKMIEAASKRFVVIVDETKMVNFLGASGLAVPVEIVPFGWRFTMEKLRRMFDGVRGFDLRLRSEGEGDGPAVTDNLNYVVDLFFEKGVGIGGDLEELSDAILKVVGVVEHGMFLGMANSVVVGGRDGSVRVMNREGEGSVLEG